jgi:hypothetical protein
VLPQVPTSDHFPNWIHRTASAFFHHPPCAEQGPGGGQGYRPDIYLLSLLSKTPFLRLSFPTWPGTEQVFKDRLANTPQVSYISENKPLSPALAHQGQLYSGQATRTSWLCVPCPPPPLLFLHFSPSFWSHLAVTHADAWDLSGAI